jgi:hypothetical protein
MISKARFNGLTLEGFSLGAFNMAIFQSTLKALIVKASIGTQR